MRQSAKVGERRENLADEALEVRRLVHEHHGMTALPHLPVPCFEAIDKYVREKEGTCSGQDNT